MIELALRVRARAYWIWLLLLVCVVAAGLAGYRLQLAQGLSVTGMGRDVSWGLYIAQFTFLVGVAASSVMVVLPLAFHRRQEFRGVAILAEFLAVSAVAMCGLFVLADLGQPQRVLYVLLHPAPGSLMFWDMLVLGGYLLLNLALGWTSLESERLGVDPPHWVPLLAPVSIVWAFAIHTVTAFLYAGLPGRPSWLTALLAARFLASAFCSGPAILLLLVLAAERLTRRAIAGTAVHTLSAIIAYALCAHVFLFLLEVFTSLYSGVPSHAAPLAFLFLGRGVSAAMGYLPTLMWLAVLLTAASLALLLPPGLRRSRTWLPVALGCLVIAVWTEKGLGFILGGLAPTVFGRTAFYAPTLTESLISLGIYAAGGLLLTGLWAIALGVRAEIDPTENQGVAGAPSPS